MVPNISDEIVEKQKTLQSGTCLGFGSAFRIPLIVKLEMPNPAPWSGNCDVVNIWTGNKKNSNSVDEKSYSNNDASDNSSPVQVSQEVVIPQFTSVNVSSDLNSNTSNNQFINNSDSSRHDEKKSSDEPSFSDIDSTLAKLVTLTESKNVNNNVMDKNDNVGLSPVSSSLDMSSQLDNRELNIPQNSVDIPNQLEVANNMSTVAPTIEDKLNNLEGGTIRIVPPTENNSIPMTDSGKPLFTVLDSGKE